MVACAISASNGAPSGVCSRPRRATAGTSIRETLPILRSAAKIMLSGLVVSVDRMERGTGEQNALAEVRDSYGMRAFSIVTIDEIMSDLRGRVVGGRVVLTEDIHAHLLDYRKLYGGRPG